MLFRPVCTVTSGPSEGLFLPITKWPLMSDHAKGTYFWDVDGNKYLDFMCAYGPNVLGYCDDDVDKAAMEQLKGVTALLLRHIKW